MGLFFNQFKRGLVSAKRYIVRLSEEERTILQATIKKLVGGSQKARRARILLKADANGPNWTDHKIAEAFDCSQRAVELIRERLVTQGFEDTLHGKARLRPSRKILSGEQEAQLIAMRLGSAPTGYGQWTLRLLRNQMIELAVVESISHETVRRTLKKIISRSENCNIGLSHRNLTGNLQLRWKTS